MSSDNERAQIASDEGNKPVAYKDSSGVLTIGIGFNLEEPGARAKLIKAGVPEEDVDSVMSEGGKALPEGVAEKLFEGSYRQARKDAAIYANKGKGKGTFEGLPSEVKNVLTNMSFQLGLTKLSKFVDSKKLLDDKNFAGFSEEILDSKWFREQTPERAQRLSDRVVDVAKGEEQSPPQPSDELAGDASGKEFNLQEAFQLEYQDGLADRLAGMLSPESQMDRWAEMLRKSNQEAKDAEGQAATKPVEDKPESVKPKMKKLEQGLFEDEAGKKFFVDDMNRLLELDDNNQPRTVIDPSKFDLSGVEDASKPLPEQEIS